MNVGHIKEEGRTVYETIMATGVVDLLLESYPRRLEMHAPWSDDRDCTPLLRGNIDVEDARLLLDSNGFEGFDLIDNGVIPRKSPTLDVEQTRAYHLVPKGISKEQAVMMDQEHRSIAREATIAIGDAEADLPFTKAAGAFFMVRNGLEHNPHLAEEIDATENAFVTEGKMGLGWAEAVETVLSL